MKVNLTRRQMKMDAWLADYMKKNKLSKKKEAYKKIGTTRQWWFVLRNGQIDFSKKQAEKFSKHFGVDIRDIYLLNLDTV